MKAVNCLPELAMQNGCGLQSKRIGIYESTVGMADRTPLPPLGGRDRKPLSSVLSPLVPRRERKKISCSHYSASLKSVTDLMRLPWCGLKVLFTGEYDTVSA